MTKDLHQQWSAAPIRVDVCYYVSALGHALTATHRDIDGPAEDRDRQGYASRVARGKRNPMSLVDAVIRVDRAPGVPAS
jgi:hypothetical protein